MKCTCGHHRNEHSPDAGWCMLCDCKGWENPDKEIKDSAMSKEKRNPYEYCKEHKTISVKTTAGCPFCLQAQLATARDKSKRLQEECRWVPVGERLPEGQGVWLVLHNGIPETYRKNDASILWTGFAKTYTHWRKTTLPEGE